MLTPSVSGQDPFNNDVIRDVMHRLEHRPRCPRANDRWRLADRTGSSFLPPRMNELLASANGFLSGGLISALAAPDALRGAASTSTRAFPFPVDESIFGFCPRSRSPVALAHRQVPFGVERYERQKPSRFGEQNFYSASLANHSPTCC